MASRWLSRVAVASAVVGAMTIASASAAAGDPPGNNGTVKIQSHDVDSNDDISNQPHVPCDFQVAFFGFDKDQTAKITFTIHPPSGEGDVLLSETKTVSDDDAAGGLNDVDAVFDYSGTSFGLDRFVFQPQQGYHVKLTVESKGIPGEKKHKVFWLQCNPSTQPPSTTQPPTTGPGTSTTPSDHNLPKTGAGLTGIITAGLALLGAGTALLIARRRREATEGAADL